MAIESRLNDRPVFLNSSKEYREFLRQKDISSIKQFTTIPMVKITNELVRSIPSDSHIWSYGDTYQKLAANYYGDPEMWWVISWFNQKPAEFLVKIGDTILIPLELVDILGYYGY